MGLHAHLDQEFPIEGNGRASPNLEQLWLTVASVYDKTDSWDSTEYDTANTELYTELL
jgi:hypothetical protein